MTDELVERVARAIVKDLIRQETGDDREAYFDRDLVWHYLDQGEVDFALVARAAIEATNYPTLETALRTIQSAVPKYLKKEMTAEEFALVVIGEADSAKVNKALEEGK